MPEPGRRYFDDHDLICHHYDPASGLRSIMAIHARRDGRACGGCRIRPYASEAEALDDVLRLSQAMSYKAALAGVPAGGAKAVIIGDPRQDKTPERLRAMGRFVDRFAGQYISAPDVGITFDDLRVMRTQTRWIVGADDVAGPSAPYTARGVFAGLRAAVRWRLRRDDLHGVRVAIQGVGSVGRELAALLAGAGARLVVADVDDAAVADVAARFGADTAPVEEILLADADVVAPCALGAVLDDDTIPRLRAQVVCGAANNQLAEPRHGQALHERGITFAPDYVVSAGGLIAGIDELNGFDPSRVDAALERIGDTLTEILRRADERGAPASEAAEDLARERIASWRR
jgi:leucine dehydrogenase